MMRRGAWARLDEDGTATWNNIPPGEYLVRAGNLERCAVLDPSGRDYYDMLCPDPDGSGVQFAETSVFMKPGEVLRVELKLPEKGGS